MYCKKCGKEIDQGTAFCKHCGTRLAEGGSSGSSDIGVMPNHTGSTMSINKLTGLLMAVISLVVVLVANVPFTPIFAMPDNMTNLFLTFVP
ncbi:MAG: zinc-ribbon domain-containing protein, partial [Christensenella sp.]